jgi:hypothetical protein
MATERMFDFLPALFHEASANTNEFLRRFVGAFEAVFGGIEDEIAAVPSLFSLAPTPVLAEYAPRYLQTIELDSAAGLCAGDVLQIEDVRHEIDPPKPPRVEFVEIAKVLGADPDPATAANPTPPPSLLPATLRLVSPLLFDHEQWAPLRLVGTDGVQGTLEFVFTPQPNDEHQAIELTGGETLGAAVGDVLRIGEGDDAEYAQVADVVDVTLVLTPRLHRSHATGQSVTLLQPPALTAPAPMLEHAERAGPELTVETPAWPGETIVELDTITGLGRDDVLLVAERDATLSEAVQIHALPHTEPTPPIRRRLGVTLTAPLRRAHGAGADVFVLEGTDVGLLVARSGGTRFLTWLASAIGLELRADRGERWNRELVRRAGSLWPWRGTRRGVEAFVESYVLGEADVDVVDPAQPLQLGLVSTLGVDAIPCGMPDFFWIELRTEERNSRMYHPAGLVSVIRAAREALRREAPAHLAYDVRVFANTMQIGGHPETEVGARLGDTTLLWSEPLLVPADEERRTG